ncbi:hypothetical protein CGK15_23645 [Vibrio parahaemolyticus]|uniref:hypothetical protein n=2 Tax=Vibrio parahaemolyticus TaxID=670 RepID=UPI001124032F|nr:hypothetical protein [Vibrio parahaemolyticus]TOA94563.1 hypothetical protein CGK15_23645 [Vibrio parahaemolyticus]
MSNNEVPFLGRTVENRDMMEWIASVDAWDYCDGSLLAKLVLKADIPSAYKPLIASIIDGSRKQKVKAAAHLKIPANERMYIAEAISMNLGLIREFKTAKLLEGETLLEHQADKEGIEPIDVKRGLENRAMEIKEDAADQLGVSIHAIDNLLRDFRYKLANFPDV